MMFSVITSSYNQLENLKKIKPHWDKQTFTDFEWIIADDGSDDETVRWCYESYIGWYSNQNKTGYNLVPTLNNAVKMARGKYLVFVMGDTYPKADFLEKLALIASENRLLTGIRLDIDWENDEVIAPEWRVKGYPSIPWWDTDFVDLPEEINFSLMTLNSMCMPRKMWDEMGGIPEEYDGYGKMDWYMGAWAHHHGYQLMIAPRAIVYHKKHEEREDTPQSTEVFKKHLEELRKL